VIRTGLGAKRAADALGAIYFDDAAISLMARSRRTNVDTGWIFAVITKARQLGDNGAIAAIKTPAAAIKLRHEPSVDCIFSPLNQNGFVTLS
jgi:hypothetical protein